MVFSKMVLAGSAKVVGLWALGSGMEDDLGAVADGPANGFGVAPAFVADGDAEGEVAGLEDLAGLAGGVSSLFLGG
jgi:hypothetical protein